MAYVELGTTLPRSGGEKNYVSLEVLYAVVGRMPDHYFAQA